MSYADLKSNSNIYNKFHCDMQSETIILDSYNRTDYSFIELLTPKFFKRLISLVTEKEHVHEFSNIIFPFGLHVMMKFMKQFKPLENSDVKYLTSEDISVRNMLLQIVTFAKNYKTRLVYTNIMSRFQ